MRLFCRAPVSFLHKRLLSTRQVPSTEVNTERFTCSSTSPHRCLQDPSTSNISNESHYPPCPSERQELRARTTGFSPLHSPLYSSLSEQKPQSPPSSVVPHSLLHPPHPMVQQGQLFIPLSIPQINRPFYTYHPAFVQVVSISGRLSHRGLPPRFIRMLMPEFIS